MGIDPNPLSRQFLPLRWPHTHGDRPRAHTSIEHSRDWCRSLLILNCQELAAQQPLRPINWCSRLLKMTATQGLAPKGVSDFTWPSGGERKGDCGLYNYLYNSPMKVLNFRGSALTDLRAFPESARREAGYQLDKVQHGLEPSDWKPMPTVGRGVQEIRRSEERRVGKERSTRWTGRPRTKHKSRTRRS